MPHGPGKWDGNGSIVGLKPIAGFFLVVTAVAVHGQTSEQNLRAYLSGRYPALRDHSALNTKQLHETRTAKVIKLDDGSMWEVDDVDTLGAMRHRSQARESKHLRTMRVRNKW
jgi:hypothetical protein